MRHTGPLCANRLTAREPRDHPGNRRDDLTPRPPILPTADGGSLSGSSQTAGRVGPGQVNDGRHHAHVLPPGRWCARVVGSRSSLDGNRAGRLQSKTSTRLKAGTMLDPTPIAPLPAPSFVTPRPLGRPRTPVDLWNAVLRARIDLADERALPRSHRQPTARVVLVGALEAYVTSLAERGHPVPYALRDEVRLQRRTCTSRYAADRDSPSS
jgi:hypothetical protein